MGPWVIVRAWREQHGSTSEIDSIAKAVVFYAGDQTNNFMKNVRVALFRW